jgi:hypothetical protein
MADNFYVITEKGYTIYNNKIHDLLNIHFKKNYKILNLDFSNSKKFIIDNNYDNIKIIFYFQNLTKYGIDILNFIKKSNLKATVFFFTFDWWINAQSKYHIDFITNIFKATNYKVITFAHNIEQLNEFHNTSYNTYKNNIIHNNFWCSYNSSFVKFNNNPINKILLSGTCTISYPERLILKQMKNIAYHNNRKEVIDTSINNYCKTLNKYLCCFSSSVIVYSDRTFTKKKMKNTHIILQKTFEILSTGSLLLYPLKEKKYIEKIGLFNKKNCWLLDFNSDIQKQLDEILDISNRKTIDEIRLNGQNHAINNLNSDKKFNEIKKIHKG